MEPRNLTQIALGTIALLFAGWAFSEETTTTYAATFGYSNIQCGSYFPSAGVDVDNDSKHYPFHFRMSVGPNGGCDGQGTSIDARVSARHDLNDAFFLSVVGGYDQRVVPFQYGDKNISGAKVFRGVAVANPSAMLGVGARFAGGTVELLYNAVTTPLADDKGDQSPFSVEYNANWDSGELGVSLQPRGIVDANITFNYGERIQFGFNVNRNGHLLKNDAEPIHNIQQIDANGDNVGSPIELHRKDNPANPLVAFTVGFRL